MRHAPSTAVSDLPGPRRSFLRQLAALPLVGGGLSLVGAPQAVAEPITADLLSAYRDWLGWEHERLCREMHGSAHRQYANLRLMIGPAWEWHRGAPPCNVTPWDTPAASTRAALVLSAVGCDWREG